MLTRGLIGKAAVCVYTKGTCQYSTLTLIVGLLTYVIWDELPPLSLALPAISLRQCGNSGCAVQALAVRQQVVDPELTFSLWDKDLGQ